MEDAIADAGHLTEPCPQKDRRKDHLIVGRIVGPRGIAEAADILGEDNCDESGVRIGEHAHGIAYPVVPRKGFGGRPVLVDEDSDGILVVQLHRDSRVRALRIVIVGVDGVRRQPAYTDRVGAEKIGRLFDVT